MIDNIMSSMLMWTDRSKTHVLFSSLRWAQGMETDPPAGLATRDGSRGRALIHPDEVKERRLLQMTQKVGGVQAVRADNPLRTVTAHMFQRVA